MNRRTLTLLIVAVVVIAGVYFIARWQRSRETQRLLADLQSMDQAAATRAMDSLRDRVPAIRSQLLDVLTGGGDDVRWRAAMLLGYGHGPAVRAALLEALKDSSPDVRLNAALSLGRIGARESAETIAAVAVDLDEETTVRLAAVRSLEMLRSYAHLPQVITLASARPPSPLWLSGMPDFTSGLRAAAMRAVAVLGAEAELHPQASAQVPGVESGSPTIALRGPGMQAAGVLADSMTAEIEPDMDVRRAAVYAMADLMRLVSDDSVRTAGLRAVISAARDEAPDVRIAAVHALRLTTAPADMVLPVRRALEAALGDDEYWVRQAAAEGTSGG